MSEAGHEPGDDPAQLVKVVFDLEPDGDWPPAATESLWAKRLSAEETELANVPWFARGYSYGDRVRVREDDDGVLWAEEQLMWSGRYTIRVIPYREGPFRGSVNEVIDRLTPLGADCESAEPAYAIVAVDIPPTARIAELKALLVRGENEGWWGYEEGCIDDAWASL